MQENETPEEQVDAYYDVVTGLEAMLRAAEARADKAEAELKEIKEWMRKCGVAEWQRSGESA